MTIICGTNGWEVCMQTLSNEPPAFRPVDMMKTGRNAAMLLAMLLPTPAFAQAWTTIRATPPSPAAYQVAKNRDDIRAGRSSGQLSKTEARDLRRENARVGDLAASYAKDGTTDSEATFIQAAAEATHGLIVAKRTQGGK
jgi:hypothetical protein